MNGSTRIHSLSRNVSDVLRFLKVSYPIYEGNPFWVAPLLSDLKRVFLDENPFLQHADIQLWIATRDGHDIGRIAAIKDRSYQQATGVNATFFGFYECIDDPAASHLLFQQAVEWSKRQSAEKILGPMNPTTNDECGLLIDGFDHRPAFMMPYNPQYYPALVDREGFTKTKDLVAYLIDLAGLPMDRLTRIGEKVLKRNPNVALRPLLRKNLVRDLGKVKEVYNAAWQENWGFTPMTDAEIDFMAARIKPLLMEGLVWLAEVDFKPVGFLLATPDYNIPLQPLRGRLFTPKTLGFLPYLFGWKRPPRARVLTLGVLDQYRNKGLETAMLIEGLKVGFRAGFTEAEASWILEDNVMMRRVIEAIGGRVYKTYRLYEKPL